MLNPFFKFLIYLIVLSACTPKENSTEGVFNPNEADRNGQDLRSTDAGPDHDSGSTIVIELPMPDYLESLYPIGIQTSPLKGVRHRIVSRYDKKPILLYLPIGNGPYPVVVFQHGRPFQMPNLNAYVPNEDLVTSTVAQGYVLAVPIRSGYYGDMQPDTEKMPCNDPMFEDFQSASQSASKDISSVLSYLKTLSFIDSTQVVLAGTSAGGFASISALSSLDSKIISVVSINGGRCGKRGPQTGGLPHLVTLYSQIGAQTQTPIYFLAGKKDQVIPEFTTRKLYDAICNSRQDCQDTVKLLVNDLGTHDLSSMVFGYQEFLEGIRKTP